MNLQQIEYILAVKDYSNFSDASESCHITQSTLSTMISRFEQELDIQIFDRKHKPVRVTKEGELIIQQLRIVKKEIDTLTEITDSLKGEIKGEVQMGVIPTIAPYLLPGFLNDFAHRLKNVSFTVAETPTESIVERLKKRELDIGILALPIQDPDLVEIPLYREPFLLYDCSDQPLPDEPTLADIDTERLWLMEEGHCLSQQVIQICDLGKKNKPSKINFHFRAGSVDSLIRFVRRNQGVTLLPFQATEDFDENEASKLRRFKDPIPSRQVGMLVHKHFVKKSLLKILQKEIQSNWSAHETDSQYIIPPLAY